MTLNYYVAKISANQCFADLRINDVPLVSEDVIGDFSVEIPINYLIESSGPQILSAKIIPNIGSLSLSKFAKCSIEIWKFDGAGPRLVPLEIVCSILLKKKEEDILPIMEEITPFVADVSYHIHRWDNCIKLENDKNFSSSVFDYFRYIGNLLADKQYEKYFELINERELNICTSLSLEPEEIEMRNNMLVNELNSGMELVPISDTCIVEFYADQRIVTLLDADLQSALRFKDIGTEDFLIIDLLLGVKDGQGTWSII